jgi:hypothetical protein
MELVQGGRNDQSSVESSIIKQHLKQEILYAETNKDF